MLIDCLFQLDSNVSSPVPFSRKKSAHRKMESRDYLSLICFACPYIARFFDAYTLDGNLHLVLEYMEGGSLEDHMKIVPGERERKKERKN